MPTKAEQRDSAMIQDAESGSLSGLYDAILFIALLGFSAVAMLALALAAPLAIAISAVAGAASAAFAGAKRRGGWESANPA